MTRRLLAIQAVAFTGLMLLVADIYAHKRVEQGGGVNMWGYRGPVARQRKPGDVRLLFVGGIRAYGYGAAADGTIGHKVEWDLNVDGDRPATVINAARFGAIAEDYGGIIRHYARLQSDYVVIHDDLGRTSSRPRRSRIAALTGYTPVLPVVMEEKGMTWRYGSSAAGYEGGPQTSGLIKSGAGRALQGLGRMLRDLESPEAPLQNVDHTTAMMSAIDAALATSLRVLIVIDPANSDPTMRNRAALLDAVGKRGDKSRIRLLDLSVVPAIDDPDSTLDGYSYSALGRQRVALAIVPEVKAMLR